MAVIVSSVFLSCFFFLIFKTSCFFFFSAKFKKVKNLFCVKSALKGEGCQKIRKKKTAWRSPGRFGSNIVSGNVVDSISHGTSRPLSRNWSD